MCLECRIVQLVLTEVIIFETNYKQCGLKLVLGPPMRDLLHSLAIEYFKKRPDKTKINMQVSVHIGHQATIIKILIIDLNRVLWLDTGSGLIINAELIMNEGFINAWSYPDTYTCRWSIIELVYTIESYMMLKCSVCLLYMYIDLNHLT